ncbi:DNA polymerase beta-like protein [Hortaea werneckii]|nr:DNA polymerase beta-like protein [Hortaea werneckii]
MAHGASQQRLKAKQQFYDDLDGALAESDDAADPGRQASIAIMERARARQNESSASSRGSRGLPRSISDTKLASRDPPSDQAPRPSLRSGEHRPPLQKGATFSAEPSKAMVPTAPPSAIPRSIIGKRKRESDIKYVPDAQQIFKGLHFYFFPNDDKNHARAMRIIKAIEFGATWQKDWNESITHVVVDRAIDYSLLLRFLKIDRLPEHVVLVSENYPASCVSYRAILDARQSQFRVKGAPEPLKTIEPFRRLPQSSAESDKSLQLKPAGKSVIARQPETQQTTVTEVHSSPQPRIGSSVANVLNSNGGPLNDNATEQDGTQQPPDTSEEFEAAVKQARELRDLPLEHEEEEEDVRPASSDGPPDTDEEERAPSPTVKQRKSKPQSMQDKFQCMQKHTGDKPGNPNAHTIEILQQMADYYGQIGDEWRIRAYRKAIGTLRNHLVKVWTMEEALALPQIGPRLAEKIEEIAITNRLRRLDNARAEPADQVLQTFMGVYGVGLAKASEWVAAGYKTLDDLLEKADVTENQRVGIDHYADFHTGIPRAEVEMHGSTVRRALHRIDEKFQVIIGGSYRRGSKDSGDIDCIITRPDTGSAHLRNVVLGQLVPELFKTGFLVASLAITRRDDGSKWHGASQLPSPQTPNPNPWRRIDLLLVPSDEIGAALIYFTGNDIFNRSLRLLASTKGMRLNQRGLYKDCMRGKGRVKITEGELVEGKDEKKIFAALNVPWRPPEHRIC